MKITRETVIRVAGLAKLALTEAETERLTHEMGKIVEFADKLAELELTAVAPTTHAVQMENVYRADELKPSYPREEILANGPERDDTCFLVPKAVDGEGPEW
ncbi:MAG: Asp-tRNA(Asn)/Glu-tRNA(Gln) amidotransferase subunit GatC [Peptococcaceae bacterium]|jgi:aspartyl-tRNA(Asn)/glutamyl-tRNA(Gln) amidotransferase subunit C|nr:Asp-tRNA(Asn)/Glu-tRNA(Gln) amidotransferase subunit GatC [Peptococcaceae bacterium]